MDIKVNKANEHNLKNVSVSIPMYQITGVTGVSGSGKSTLLRDIIAAKGAINFTSIHTKTVRDALQINDYVKADSIENLPQTIFIDVKSTVKNTASTVSTISGIQELLRNLFTEIGEMHCPLCGNTSFDLLPSSTIFMSDIIYDERYSEVVSYLNKRGKIIEELFYDKSGKPAKKSNISFTTIGFTLNNPNDSSIRRFNREFGTSIYIKHKDYSYNPLNTLLCPKCDQLLPRLTRSRLSFNTAYEDGGGACRCCNGSGTISSINPEQLIIDSSKPFLNGAVAFVSEKGIKYTNITEVFIKATADHYGIDINLPINKLTKDQKNTLFYGGTDSITFKDRIGGKKSLVFEGVLVYLTESYKCGKGKTALTAYFSELNCPECNGTRFDKLIDSFTVSGNSIRQILSMTITRFGEWCRNEINNSTSGRGYFETLISKCKHYEAVSCGHLSLDRKSNSLSGGELQRLRLCSLLNSDIDNICYLLDEPSSGLHYSDIEKLGVLFREICESGNTIIIVEHNRKLLEFCDNIIDMGPYGGERGGNILLADSLQNISQYDTPTVEYLLNSEIVEPVKADTESSSDSDDYMEFSHLNYNNLKDITVHIPYSKITSVCGVSGSGKTTLVKYVIYQSVMSNPSEYGFTDVYFFSQDNISASSLSTIATQTQIMEYIAKLFAKASKLDKKNFILGSKEGKCPKCFGKGILLSADNENLGVCSLCHGQKYNHSILDVKINEFNISQLMDLPVSELYNCIDDPKLKRLSEIFTKFDIGYLSLSRSIKTLSKGEMQRLRLAIALTEKREHTLFLLDEPAKGLHPLNIETLANAIHELIQLNNTVISVEHEPLMIKNSDHIIEFGGTGTDGGYLLYEGNPAEIPHTTPTGRMLNHVFSLMKKSTQREAASTISISCAEKFFTIPRFTLVRDTENTDLIDSAVSWISEKYLSVAIPNNIFFSKVNSDTLSITAPIAIEIDFSKTIRYEISLYSALGIKQLLLRKIQFLYPNDFDLLKWIFDEKSSTGKCSKCRGTGKISDIPRDYFLSDGELSKSCIKFLNSSTQYKETKKLLKSKFKIDIAQKYSEMNDNERNILFLGTDDNILFDNESIEWNGIIEQFLLYHKYYPENDSDAVFRRKKEVTCPICMGKRIQKEFSNYTIWGLNFGELMSLPLKSVINSIQDNLSESIIDNVVLAILKHMICLGLGNYSLSTTLLSMNSKDSQLANFVAKYANNIFGAFIVIKNISMLNKEQQTYIKKIAETWKSTNTLILSE